MPSPRDTLSRRLRRRPRSPRKLTFEPAVSLPVVAFPSAVAIGDFNADGHADIAVAGHLAVDDGVAILRGAGDVTFEEMEEFPIGGLSPVSLAQGDLNGDGVADLVTANLDASSADQALSVLLSRGAGTPPPTRTGTDTAMPTATRTPTPTATSSSTGTATPTPTPTPSRTPEPCVGDCDGSLRVTTEELVAGVEFALTGAPLASCPSFDRDGDSQVTVDELVAAVANARGACPV